LVDLDLPRWEYTYCIDDLRGVLGRLGMGIAFSGGAGVGGPAGVAGVDPEDEPDFSNMFARSSRSARISQAVHKTWICVNEQGTGVAATTIRESQHAGEPEPLSRRTRVIRADHPFLYIVMEKQQHLILLTGIVNDPSSGGVVMGVAAPVRKKWKLSGHR